MACGVTSDLMDEGMVMAAIDLGTSYSGIAYAVRKTYQEDRLNIIGANFEDPRQTQADKVPTAVLFSPNKRFHSFGQEAEDKFFTLCQENEEEAKKWLYFHRFKMLLFDVKTLSEQTEVTDYWERNTMPAIAVFAAAIRHLKTRLLARLARRMTIKMREIDWTLTIPAIWNDKARQFMRRAAVEAGIPNDRLMLALEPEAATVYCRVRSEEDFKAGRPLHFDLRPIPENRNKKFMVLDCGGGTVDLTVYAIDDDEMRLRELHHPSGGDWGGTKVDKAFMELLYSILGFEGTTAINQAELLATMKAFEQAKRDFRAGSRVYIQVPPSASILFEEGNYSRCPSVKMLDGKLSIDSETFVGFFKDKIDAIVQHVQSVLAHPSVNGVDTLLMVGGFSSSCLLQGAIRKAFGQQTQVVIPTRAAPSILMGAVLFLLEPNVVGWRAAAYTYGVEIWTKFDPDVHDEEHAFTADGVKMCGNLFRKLISVNEVVAVGTETLQRVFHPMARDQRETTFSIFASPLADVRYTTDPSCHKVGAVLVQHGEPIPDERQRSIEVKVVVGGIEMNVVARDTRSGNFFQAKCLFLAN